MRIRRLFTNCVSQIRKNNEHLECFRQTTSRVSCGFPTASGLLLINCVMTVIGLDQTRYLTLMRPRDSISGIGHLGNIRFPRRMYLSASSFEVHHTVPAPSSPRCNLSTVAVQITMADSQTIRVSHLGGIDVGYVLSPHNRVSCHQNTDIP